MKRIGMTQCVISPQSATGSRLPLDANKRLDFSCYDRYVKLYRQAGFEDPPVLAIEAEMHEIAAAVGKVAAMKFSDPFPANPGVKANEVPAEVVELAGQVMRQIRDHSSAAKWSPCYFYFADEPNSGSLTMEKAKFMTGVARRVAPDLQLAETVYTLEWWSDLRGMLDLNIAHYVHPCHDAAANRQWLERAQQERAKLYGIDFIGPLDIYWEARRITFTAEKGTLAGMLCWTQQVGGEELRRSAFDPYLFVTQTWGGGPWVMPDSAGRVWRSLPWIGLREGIDDSRYVQTLRKAIEEAKAKGRPEIAERAAKKLDDAMDQVPWSNDKKRNWTAAGADAVRRSLADAAIECLNAVGR
jgi:hypothetical protein